MIDDAPGQCGDLETYSTYICYNDAEAAADDQNPICGAYNE